MVKLAALPSSDRPPIFVGAGVIKSEELIRYFAEEPLLAVQVAGSFSGPEWGGADPSGQLNVFWWDEDNKAAYNAIGLRNCGREAASKFLPDALKVAKEAGQLVLVSVTALAHEDPAIVLPDMAEWTLEMGADGVEVNASCPNQVLHSLLCENADKTGETIDTIRERIGREPYMQAKFSPLGKAVINRYRTDHRLAVNAVVAINNCRRMSPKHPLTGQLVIEVNDGYAGQSGPIISDLARTNVAMWAQEANAAINEALGEPYPVWSIGGVDNGIEVYDRQKNLGAVMVGGAQEFYRAQDPRAEVRRWANEYAEAARQQ